MKVTLLLVLLFINIKALITLLKETETPKQDKAVYIHTRPTRPVILAYIGEPEPIEPDVVQELKEKFKERRKAWDNMTVWNEENNVLEFKRKYGLSSDVSVNTKEGTNGLFRLTAI